MFEDSGRGDSHKEKNTVYGMCAGVGGNDCIVSEGMQADGGN